MSRAFAKEDVDLPERSGRKRAASGLPPGATNYIAARGAKHLRDELTKLRGAKVKVLLITLRTALSAARRSAGSAARYWATGGSCHVGDDIR